MYMLGLCTRITIPSTRALDVTSISYEGFSHPSSCVIERRKRRKRREEKDETEGSRQVINTTSANPKALESGQIRRCSIAPSMPLIPLG